MAQFHDNTPLYLQIKEKIEDEIVKGHLQADEQIPSTTQMVQFYKINHITIMKGINLLVDEGLIYKKRGLGMFVAQGARERLLESRQAQFANTFVLPMIQEAKKLGFSREEVHEIIVAIETGDPHDKA